MGSTPPPGMRVWDPHQLSQGHHACSASFTSPLPCLYPMPLGRRLTTGAGTEADRAQALASLVVLLGQLGPDTPTPAPVIELAPTLVEYVKSDPDLHVKHNATALLTGLLGTDEAVWKSLVIDSNVLVGFLLLSYVCESTPTSLYTSRRCCCMCRILAV